MKKNVLKKLLAMLLVFAMSAPVIGYLGTNAGEVQAAEEEKTVGYVIVPSTAVDITEPTDKTQPKLMSVKADDATYGQYADYIFAGWYTDEAATVAAASGTTGAYARFVPNDVLSTKVQVTNGIVTNTTNSAYKDKYVMRFVSSVDSTDYQYAGFELSYGDQILESKTYKAFKRIDSTTGATDTSVDTYEFSPKVVDTKSEYFITGKYPIAEADKDVNYTVRAYWMTKDGTKVYGRERCVSVEDGIDNTRLNLTVDGELTIGGQYSASYKNKNEKDVTIASSNVEVLTSGNGYSNIRLKGASRDTKSATTITIKNGDNKITEGLYRNLYTKYTGTADTTWYDMYSATDDEFIIASSADLYGLAAITTKIDDKIYVVSDIDANPEKLELLENENYLKWYTYDTDNQKAYQAAPSYSWTPIGTSTTKFNGVFDGQMHTISGVYLNTSSQYGGLFAATGADANICNLKLKNSYFKTSANNIGSIVGQAQGTFSNIYSDAIVKSSAVNVGGLIGRVASSSFVDMDECWYAGNVSVTNSISDERQIGGLIGYVLASTSATSITNCFNSGTIDATSETNSTVAAGGLVGRDNAGNVEISNSLNVGSVEQSSSTTNYYGPIIGQSKATSLIMPNTYATTESSRSTANSGFTSVPFESVVESTVIDWDAATILTNLGELWTKADYRTPVLKVFKNESDGRIDVSWYDENSSEYTLYDEEDLYGFTWISKLSDFSGKTVKLGADIVVNEGTASADWASKSNYRQWWPIGLKKSNSLNSFQGTFNGQGHTISGLYLDFVKSGEFDGRYAGLFAGVGESGTVENLRLTESYFQSNARDFGGVAGIGKGKFYNIYNSVIMNAYAYVVQNTDDTFSEILNTLTCGGIIGMTTNEVVLDKCWFAGAVTNNYNNTNHQGTGGLIGYVHTGTVTMTNCMNSGTVKMDTQRANATARLGGFIGYTNKEIPITMNACLNTGSVTASTTATKGYGPLVGYCYSRDLVSVSATYVLDSTDIPKDDPTVEYPQNTVNNLAPTTTYGVVTESDMKTNAATIMPLLDWSDEWKAVSDAMPELNFDYTTSVNGQKFVATSDEQTALNNLYDGRTLLQGEMHNHAQTYGRGQGSARGDDGTVPLATWKEQLEALDMDFAASLDHDQTDHIYHDDWDTSKFVYGSEARAFITDLKDQTLDGALHFDMIFKTQAQFVSIMEKYPTQFGLDSSFSTGTDQFITDNMYFTKAQFATFIRDVYDAGGVVNFPHPRNDAKNYYSNELEDFIFEVQNAAGKQIIYGFHVITSSLGSLTTGGSRNNYPAWVSLLNEGYRIYATAGSDNHADLHARTLTSIYATTCKDGCDGSCKDEDCAAYDKGNIISQLSCGDYVAGSVGIKMCIGNTAMGGSRTFIEGDRLVISIGDVHTGYRDDATSSEHLRVDVINEDGIVYSQKVVTNDTIAFNVDPDSDYYRVVIYNVNRSFLIAIGNPIWNDADLN